MLWAKHIAEGNWPLLFIAQPYQFPFESYLMSLLVDWMPRNAFGARYQAFTLGWLALGLMLVIAAKILPKGSRWPALLLILLPSAYWVQHSSGYTPPQYASTLFFVVLILFLASSATLTKRNGWFIFIAALIAGLSTSNHLVAAPTMVAAVIVLLLVKSNHNGLRRIIILAAGLSLGLAPYLWVTLTQPEAYGEVSETVTLLQAGLNFYEFAIPQALAGVMGIKPTLFTDLKLEVGWGLFLRWPFVCIYLFILITALVYRVISLYQELRVNKTLSSQTIDIFILSTLGTLAAFSVADKAGWDQYRFLLPIVCSFPFIVAFVYHHFLKSRVAAKILGTFVMAYASLNVIYLSQMIMLWTDDDNDVAKIAYTADLASVIDYLNATKVTHCYASFWIAYRITFETDNRITCAQPYNERFPGWPVPYKEEVDQQENTPAIMMESDRSTLSAYRFMQHLYTSFLHSDRTRIGPYIVFDNFIHKKFKQSKKLSVPSEAYSVFYDPASGGGPLVQLNGDNPTLRWVSEKNQHKGMRLRVELEETYPIDLVDLAYHDENESKPVATAIYAYRGDQLVGETGDFFQQWMIISYELGKPVYGQSRQRIRFKETVQADRIEIEIYKPNPGYKWELDGITLSGSAVDKID